MKAQCDESAEEYCWAITQAAGRSSCGQSGFRVSEFRFHLVPIVLSSSSYSVFCDRSAASSKAVHQKVLQKFQYHKFSLRLSSSCLLFLPRLLFRPLSSNNMFYKTLPPQDVTSPVSLFFSWLYVGCSSPPELCAYSQGRPNWTSPTPFSYNL